MNTATIFIENVISIQSLKSMLETGRFSSIDYSICGFKVYEFEDGSKISIADYLMDTDSDSDSDSDAPTRILTITTSHEIS